MEPDLWRRHEDTLYVFNQSRGLQVIGLENPDAPVLRGSLPLPALGEEMFIESSIHAFDVSNPGRGFLAYPPIPLPGIVGDPFKLRISNSILAVIVQETVGPSGGTRTSLRTRRLDESGEDASWTRLAEVRLAENETLVATRFDGDRAYIVTCRVVDPLRVIDLSDPAARRILGGLEIPGWSTYFHPLGDRLLTVGIDVTT